MQLFADVGPLVSDVRGVGISVHKLDNQAPTKAPPKNKINKLLQKKNRAKGDSASLSTQKRPAVPFPSPSQLDPEVLSELPDDLRQEIENEYKKRKRLNPQKERPKSFVQEPAKSDKRRKLSFATHRTTAQASPSTRPSEYGLPPSSQVDESFLSALPEDIRAEIRAAYAQSNAAVSSEDIPTDNQAQGGEQQLRGVSDSAQPQCFSCSNCDARPATVRCEDCEHEPFCDECDAFLHQSRARMVHKRIMVGADVVNHKGPDKSAQDQAICAQCRGTIAAIFCVECEVALCLACKEASHQTEAKQQHISLALQQPPTEKASDIPIIDLSRVSPTVLETKAPAPNLHGAQTIDDLRTLLLSWISEHVDCPFLFTQTHSSTVVAVDRPNRRLECIYLTVD